MSGRIIEITLDDKYLLRSDTFKSERERIITDFLKSNSICVKDQQDSEYKAIAGFSDGRFYMRLHSGNEMQAEIKLSLAKLRQIIRDYHIICDSYFDAVNTADPRKVEAIDMGRRGVHDEGAEIILELTEGQAVIDFETARHIFALIAVLSRK